MIQFFHCFKVKFNHYNAVIADSSEIGETVVRMDELLAETKSFEKSCQFDINKAKDVVAQGMTFVTI